MATLVLGTVGTVFGGRAGGAIGAYLGSQIDAAIMPSKAAERGRLKELAVTTSSYGEPIARHYGAVRAGGSVIWATDLKEHHETSSGKGKPKVKTYSYTISFAVALSSGPIRDVGRIWADGNLLRGAGGGGADDELKVGGAMRIYRGEGDQMPDPLISADQAGAPAFRGLSYVVFEDLELADYGNRIPSLSFEIFATEGEISFADIIGDFAGDTNSMVTLPGTKGLSYEGGPLGNLITGLGSFYPLVTMVNDGAISLRPLKADSEHAPLLPETLTGGEAREQGGQGGNIQTRSAPDRISYAGLRYYDQDRDYQPSVQRAGGRPGNGDAALEELPVTLTSGDARALITRAEKRGHYRRQRLKRRIAEIESALDLSQAVRVPGEAGLWAIESWEWNEDGVELELSRIAPDHGIAARSDPGTGMLARDKIYGPTHMHAFELPPENADSLNAATIFIAAASTGADWGGAALYKDENGGLVPCGIAPREPCVMGVIKSAIGPSDALLFEESAAIEVETLSSAMVFASADIAGIASGENRVLVGGEVIQFAKAEQLSPTLWRLSGLLRGRGGTEYVAISGHDIGSKLTLIDSRITKLEGVTALSRPSMRIAAIGKGDGEAIYCEVANIGIIARPLPPVHLRMERKSNGDYHLRWTRRSRGEWDWPLGGEVALNEESERYRILIGDPALPIATWELAEYSFTVPAADAVLYAGKEISVVHIGRNGPSLPSKFVNLL